VRWCACLVRMKREEGTQQSLLVQYTCKYIVVNIFSILPRAASYIIVVFCFFGVMGVEERMVVVW